MSNATRLAILTLYVTAKLGRYDAAKPGPESVKCFDELGCFLPIGHSLFRITGSLTSLFPADRESIDTRFKLYTPYNTEVPFVFSNIYGNEIEQLQKSTFNPKADSKFVIPGYMSEMSSTWIKTLIDALMMENGCNVFLVDWIKGNGPVYEQAVANTKVVGAETALFITRLQKIYGVQPDTMHLIGHSCGAHIAGYAGKRLSKLKRITALDPAGPIFADMHPAERLNKNDASFVDAIHTNAAQSVFKGFGLLESIGHFDFYPNGGSDQPGCKQPLNTILNLFSNPKLDLNIIDNVQCNHLRAIDIFICTIRNPYCNLAGVLCDSWENYIRGRCGSCQDGTAKICVPLGIHSDRYASVIWGNQSLKFYLKTTESEPFTHQYI